VATACQQPDFKTRSLINSKTSAKIHTTRMRMVMVMGIGMGYGMGMALGLRGAMPKWLQSIKSQQSQPSPYRCQPSSCDDIPESRYPALPQSAN